MHDLCLRQQSIEQCIQLELKKLGMEQVIKIQNGEKQSSFFSDKEMANRLSKLRENMLVEKLDAVLFTSIHNINYFNHFVYCAFGRPYGLIVTQNKLVSITANIDGGQPCRRGFGENIIYLNKKTSLIPGWPLFRTYLRHNG